MATKTWSGAVYPIGTAAFDVPARMLEMANSLNPVTVPHFATKSARNTAANDLPAGHRAVCWVDGNVGLCAYNGTAWVNLSPPKRYGFEHLLGATVAAGGNWVDPSPLSIPGGVNSQVIDVEIEATVRQNGVANGSRTSVAVGVSPTNAVITTTDPAPEIVQSFGFSDEWKTYPRKLSFYVNSGTVTLSPAVFAGTTGGLLVSLVKMTALLYPMDAA